MNAFRRRLLPCRPALSLSRQKTDSPVAVAAAAKEQFYEQFAAAMLARLWPLQLVSRWIRTLSLCGSDPASIKLQLSRSASRSTNKGKWVSDLLWNIADTSDIDKIKALKVPPKDVGQLLPADLKSAMMDVYKMRSPVILLPNTSAQADAAVQKRRITPAHSFSTIANTFCEEMPEEVVMSIIEILKNYAKEAMSDEQFVSELVDQASIHGELLHPLFRQYSIALDSKLKKKIKSKGARKKALLESAVEEISQFAESITGMACEGRKKLFTKKNFRAPTEWVSRPYGKEHCLAVSVEVNIDYEALYNKSDGSSPEDTGPIKSAEEWFHPSRANHFEAYDQKIFLRNLPSTVTVEDIRLSFAACDPDVAHRLLRWKPRPKKTAPSDEEKAAKQHNIELSPVYAVHLVKDDLDDVAFKFMYDLPPDHDPVFTDGATSVADTELESSTSTSAAVSPQPAEPKHNASVDPDADMKGEEEPLPETPSVRDEAYAFTSADRLGYSMTKQLSSKRVKTALLTEKIPESYAFVVMKSPAAHENALARDMRVLGVLIAGSTVYTKDVEDLRQLVFEVNYNATSESARHVTCLDEALLLLRNVLSGQFEVGAPLWKESGPLGRRREFNQQEGPSQPAFILLRFSTHQDAWAAYRRLCTHSDTPGFVSWVFSKHYRWVAKQTDAFEKISTPMLVDSFFGKAKNGGIKIVPDLRDEYTT